MIAKLPVKNQRPEAGEGLDFSSASVLGFSWLLVVGIGLLPLFESMAQRPPSISMPAVIVFFVATGSGAALRRRYDWVGLVLHIFGQILIWLSLFVMSLALALYLAG